MATLMTRRSFFDRAALLSAASLNWRAFAQQFHRERTRDESFWQLIKDQFPLRKNLIYLNAANVCPPPNPVLSRYLRFLRDFESEPSFQNREKYLEQKERLRSKLARLLRVDPDEIAITRNTSEGNNVIVHGIDLKPGDEVLITSHNHPSNKEAWFVHARRTGFDVKVVPTPAPAKSPEQLVDGIARAITSRTKVVAITHVTNTNGLLYPVKAIAELVRPRGIWLHVDGAQSFGALDIDLRSLDCDSFTASSHKWPMGPLESGVLYVRKDRIPQLWPSIVTAGWSDELKGARRFEVVGQRDDPRLVAFEAAVDFLELIGMEHIEQRMRALANRLKQRLAEIPGITLRTNMEPELSAGVVRFTSARRSTPELYDLLYLRFRIAAAKTDSGEWEGVRLCPHIYNSMEEIDATVDAIRQLAT